MLLVIRVVFDKTKLQLFKNKTKVLLIIIKIDNNDSDEKSAQISISMILFASLLKGRQRFRSYKMLRCWNSGLTLLLCQLAGLSLLELSDASHGFRSQQATAPVTADFVVAFIVVGLDGLDKLGQVCAISILDVLQSDGGAGLAVDETSQARLALDDAVWDSHLAAQGWQEQNQLKT